MTVLMRNVCVLFLSLLICVNFTFAMVPVKTIQKIMDGIVSGLYDDAIKEHKMFPLLIEYLGNPKPFSPENIKSILWLKKNTEPNENPYLVYTRTQWKAFSFDKVKNTTFCHYPCASKYSQSNESFNVEEVCTSKTQIFTSKPDEINKEIACHKDVRSFFKYNPQFKTCLCECIRPILHIKQHLQIVTSENIKSTLVELIDLYRKQQQRDKRIADSAHLPTDKSNQPISSMRLDDTVSL